MSETELEWRADIQTLRNQLKKVEYTILAHPDLAQRKDFAISELHHLATLTFAIADKRS